MLTLPPWYFASETDNYTGTPDTNAGTAITAGTSNNDGSSVAVLTAIAHEVQYLEIGLSGFFVAAAAHYCLVDILIDPAGGSSWASTPLIDNLVCGYTVAGGLTAAAGLWYHFPLYVPSGASLGARARTSHTATGANERVHMRAYGNPSRPDVWWCGSKVETLGVTEASSIGTSHTPGNSGTYSSWANIGATISGRYGAVQFGTNGTDATAANISYYWQLGYGGNRLPGSPTHWHGLGTSEMGGHNWMRGPIWCDIPAGTQMQIRATSNGTSEVFAGGVAIYGVY